MFFKPTAGLEYIPAKLSQGTEWYVYFYVTDPSAGNMRRIRMKINRIRNKKERLRTARQMILALNERLALGWNPLIEKTAPKAGTNLFETMDLFISVKSRDAEANSIRCYESFIKTIRNWLKSRSSSAEKMPVMSFTRQVALEFMRDIDMNEKFSVYTYNNYLRFCILLFNWFKEKGYIPENPFAGMKRKPKRLAKKTRRMLDDGEIGKLIEFLKIKNPNYLAICMMCYCCLLRPKEIALLRCGDIDLEGHIIHIRAEIAKNDNESVRTIPDEMMPYIMTLDLSEPSHFLFSADITHVFGSGKKKLQSQRISGYWKDVVRKGCGFPDEIQFYSLKDTGITNMIDSGVPVSFVKQQADHSDLSMTGTYLGKNLKRANEKLRTVSLLK